MTYEEKCELFWKQYHGEILATDLPQEYIEYDKRCYCVNEHCFVRQRCRLFNTYVKCCNVFGRSVMRDCIADAKGRWKRPSWEKRSNDVNYMSASFGMNPEQHGSKPCKFFILKDD